MLARWSIETTLPFRWNRFEGDALRAEGELHETAVMASSVRRNNSPTVFILNPIYSFRPCGFDYVYLTFPSTYWG